MDANGSILTYEILYLWFIICLKGLDHIKPMISITRNLPTYNYNFWVMIYYYKYLPTYLSMYLLVTCGIGVIKNDDMWCVYQHQNDDHYKPLVKLAMLK
jgi:hypothetical protein